MLKQSRFVGRQWLMGLIRRDSEAHPRGKIENIEKKWRSSDDVKSRFECYYKVEGNPMHVDSDGQLSAAKTEVEMATLPGRDDEVELNNNGLIKTNH